MDGVILSAILPPTRVREPLCELFGAQRNAVCRTAMSSGPKNGSTVTELQWAADTCQLRTQSQDTSPIKIFPEWRKKTCTYLRPASTKFWITSLRHRNTCRSLSLQTTNDMRALASACEQRQVPPRFSGGVLWETAPSWEGPAVFGRSGTLHQYGGEKELHETNDSTGQRGVNCVH
jgi:hypothetical protein